MTGVSILISSGWTVHSGCFEPAFWKSILRMTRILNCFFEVLQRFLSVYKQQQLTRIASDIVFKGRDPYLHGSVGGLRRAVCLQFDG